MYIDHDVPFIQGHLLEGLVSQNPCVVDEDIDSAKFIDRRLNNSLRTLAIGYGILVCDSLPPRCPDLFNDRICCITLTTAINPATQIINNNLGTCSTQQ